MSLWLACSPVLQIHQVVRIPDGLLRASFRFAISEALLAEYRAVLLRPKLLKLHGLSALKVDQVLTDLAQYAIVLPVIAPIEASRAAAASHHHAAGFRGAGAGLRQYAVLLA
jgi:hypothetical protein